MQTVRIAVEGSGKLTLEELNDFQGNLKELTEENFAKLRKEIEETGFAFAFHVWKDPDGKHWILDGHQRRRVLTRMKEEGVEIPPLPVCEVEARTYKEAKRRVLQGTSQYGVMTGQGLYEFMSESEIDFEDLEKSFRMPDINVEGFKLEYFDDVMPADIDGSMTQDEINTAMNFIIKCTDAEELASVQRHFKTNANKITFVKFIEATA